MDAQNECKEELGEGKKGVQRRWMLELKLSDKREAEWRKVGKLVIDKYRGRNRKKNSFNILWSNTETLMPAVYNSLPKPDVRRRFKDADPVGKAVSEVLSRSLEFSIDIEQFDTAIKQTLLDMLLTGRGVNRVRYVPKLVTLPNGEENEQIEGKTSEVMESDESEEVAWEQVVIEHVQWDDFRMGAGKNWEEVQWIAFHHRMTRDDLIEKFGDIGETLKLDESNDEDVNREDESTVDAFKTASVWEIWDKDEKEVIFVSQSATEPLSIIDDPLKLTSFFPIARPVYAIMDSSTLVPLPLYSQYQEQAEELDRISTRINKIIDALKVRGIYDSTMSEVSELLKGNDNDLIPAQNAAAWLERGGIEKAIWMMPIDKAAQVVTILTQQREQCKQVIYEINGLGDILRGASNANETLGAQQIKAQWGTMRISTVQRELQRHIRDTMRLMAEIIGEKFQLETLQKMTGLNYPTEAQVQQQMAQFQQAMMQFQQQAMMAQQQGQQPQGQPPQQPQVPPYTWESIQAILKDDCQRTYKVDVETDSTTASTIQEDMKGLTELLSGITQFMQGVAPAIQMGALPMEAAKEIMLTIVRRSKMGNAVEDALDKMKEPQPQPDPNAAAQQQAQAQQQDDMQKHQAEMQAKQGEMQANMQLEQAKMQQQQQIEQFKAQQQAQSEQMRAQADAQASQAQAEATMQVEQMKAQLQSQLKQSEFEHQGQMEMFKINKEQEFEKWKAELDASTRILTAQISAKTTMDTAMMAATQAANAEVTESLGGEEDDKMGQIMQMHSEAMGKIGDVMKSLQKPKVIIRDENGKMSGVQ